MKMKVNELRSYIKDVLSEVKKKKERAGKSAAILRKDGYGYSESFDFSAPLGAYNLYKSQGAVNWGPQTGPGTKIDDTIAGSRVNADDRMRQYVGDVVKEVISNDESAWKRLAEMDKSRMNVWERAAAALDRKKTK